MVHLIQQLKQIVFMQLENAPVCQTAERAQVNIVILAGGFNTELVNEIIHKNQNDTLVKDTTATMLRRSKVCLLSCSPELV